VCVRELYIRGSQGSGERLNPVLWTWRVERCSVRGSLGWGGYLHRENVTLIRGH
jgi:hypothetical protein